MVGNYKENDSDIKIGMGSIGGAQYGAPIATIKMMMVNLRK